jgi:hypothetical protein
MNVHPFDRGKRPPRQNLFFLPIIWLLCGWIGLRNRLTIQKKNMKGLKPPFLVLATHHSFMDFIVTPLALFPHRANYISELEGFENYGEWLYRQAGCLGTRKFITDRLLVKNILRVLARKDILVLYPEARYANVGTQAKFPESVSKLVKLAKVPVVTLNMKGNYLQSPIWNLKKRQGVPLTAEIQQLLSAKDVQQLASIEIQQRLEAALSYDEYAWQLEENIRITYPQRAEGLHQVLYQCIKCQTEHLLQTTGIYLSCQHCHEAWELTELGQLENLSSKEKVHIPDWYEWQRQQVEREIQQHNYWLQVAVEVEALPNAVNFIKLGTGWLEHTKDGFRLSLANQTEQSPLVFTPRETFSIHTEYDYRNKGPCIVLSTLDNSYFIFSKERQFNPTKLQFAAEYLYQIT